MGKSYKDRPDKYKYQSNKKKNKNKQKSNRPLNNPDEKYDSYE
jgi:hypothetical protein